FTIPPHPPSTLFPYTTLFRSAFVPPFARWPYEVHLAPINHRGGLTDLDAQDDESFARNLKGLLQKYDRLFAKPLPYVMAMHQRRSEEHTSELQSRFDLVCRLL